MNLAISLFAGMESGHSHVCCKNDVGEELYSLLMSARDLYKEEVVNNKRMTAKMFAEVFCHSRRHIDCGRARCRNAHETNMRIVWHVLSAGENFVKKYLLADVFTVSLCEEMVDSLLGCDAPPLPTTNKKNSQGNPLSFGCSLTDKSSIREVFFNINIQVGYNLLAHFRQPVFHDKNCKNLLILVIENAFCFQYRLIFYTLEYSTPNVIFV